MRPGVVPNAQTLVAADDNVTMLLRPGYLDCGMPIVANRTDVGAGEGKKGRESGRGGEREGGGRERGREERGREERERGREEKRGERLGLKIASSRQKNNLISKENISHRKKNTKHFPTSLLSRRRRPRLLRRLCLRLHPGRPPARLEEPSEPAAPGVDEAVD
jgi:hypothetical protein